MSAAQELTCVSLKDQVSAAEWQTRVDLAACYRLIAMHGWDDLIFTHISAKIPGVDEFLINPFGLMFHEITASSLVKIDLAGKKLMDSPYEINPAGYTKEEILYQDCRFLQADDRGQPGLQIIREALKNGEHCRQVIRNFRKDGSPFWNELSITPIYNESDNLVYFIGIQKNVTEHVQAQERIKQLEDEVARLKTQLADRNPDA